MAEVRLRWREMLPIVTRELRAASKRRWTYRLRWIVALAGAAQLFLAALLLPGFSASFGKVLFLLVSFLGMALCGGAGLVLTADSISHEKRERTLGLLFLTRLSSLDIVLGKLAVGLLTGGSVAFAGLPFLAFSLCMGGVTAWEFWRMSFLLLFLLAFSLTTGIFVSTLFRKESAASFAFLAALFLPLAAVPLVVMKAMPPLFAVLNPFYPTLAAADFWGSYFPSEFVGPALLVQFLMMGGMLAISCLILPWFVRESPGGPKPVVPGARRLRRVNRRALLETNPVLWLSQRENHPLVLLYVCVGLRFLVGFVTTVPFEAEVTYVALLAILPKVFMVWHASGMMAAERSSGFLEALLTTPLPPAEILSGKVRAIKRQVAPALFFALVVQWAISTEWWGASHDIPVSTTVTLAVMISLIVDAHTVSWVGLWSGLVARDRRRALLRAMFWGVLAPWLPAVGVYSALAFLFEPRWMNEAVNVVPPMMISANIVSVGLACWAMGRLHDRFRSTGTQSWSLRAV